MFYNLCYLFSSDKLHTIEKFILDAKFKSKTKKPRIKFVLIAQVHILDAGHYKIYNW